MACEFCGMPFTLFRREALVDIGHGVQAGTGFHTRCKRRIDRHLEEARWWAEKVRHPRCGTMVPRNQLDEHFVCSCRPRSN